MSDLPTRADAGDTPLPRRTFNTRGPGTATLVEELRLDQQARWRTGDRVSVETYLERHPALRADPEALIDLIYSEFAQRVLNGEQPRAEEYLERFPEHRAQLERQFAVHELLIADGALPEATQVSPPSANPQPMMVGKYRVIALIAESGQAFVYRGVHPALGLDVAIKLSRQPLHAAADRDRLLREGRLLAELDHPGLARVHDFDLHEGRPFLVMDYVRGRTLDQELREEGMSPRVAADRVASVADALAAVHRCGVIHHDVKPPNILIDVTGRPRLIDFGLAMLRSAWTDETAPAGSVWGSAPFMAPEQARGETARIGPQTDLFALGAVLYYLLVGQPPFAGTRFEDVLERARRCDWDREALRTARVPRRLKAICARALSAEPEQRYRRAEDLAADLRVWLHRRWLIGGSIAAGGLFLLGLTAFGPRDQRPPAMPTPPTHAAVVRPDPLTVRVWRTNRYIDMPDPTPLHNGDQVRIRAAIPAEMHGSLFAVNAAGLVALLRDVPPADAVQELTFPASEGQAVPLGGPPGTELVLVCGRRSGRVTVAELQRWWNEPWPALPEASVLRLERERVVVEQKGRDFGAPRDRPDPEGEVRRRLEELRGRLLGQVDYFEGLAFAHQK
jgi:predicted Ser/Thr protein kinase